MYLNLNSSVIFVKVSAGKFMYFLSIAFFSVACLSACGGSSDPTPPASAMTTIDSNNTRDITLAATDTFFMVDDIDNYIVSDTGEQSKSDKLKVTVDATRASIRGLNSITDNEQNVPVACAVSGSMTFIAGSLTHAVTGSVLNINFNKCNDGDEEEVFNGQLEINIIDIDGDLEMFNSADFKIKFTEFTVMDDNENSKSIVVNGDSRITVDLSTSAAQNVHITGENLSFTDMDNKLSISSFAHDYTQQTVSGDSQSSGKGKLASNKFQKYVGYQTDSTFKNNEKDKLYISEWRITGADNSSLRVEINEKASVDTASSSSALTVTISADYDGDGDYDSTWTDSASLHTVGAGSEWTFNKTAIKSMIEDMLLE